MSNFHPLDFVGRGSETQLQVGEKLNKVTFNVMQFSETVLRHHRSAFTAGQLLGDNNA